MSRGPQRTMALAAATWAITLVVVVAASEAILRLAGFAPQKSFRPVVSIYEPDPVLGWRNKEGRYRIPPYSAGADEVQITILSDGRRATGPSPTQERRGEAGEIVLVGGSFTQGWAISDHETFAWKLQEALPRHRVLNYGTGAYGSYQSLLVLERELPRLNSPRLVLYGFIADHEFRNVAAHGWMRNLAAIRASSPMVQIPYATLDPGNALVRHRPEAYLRLPLRHRLALVAFIEDRYMDVVDGVGSADRLQQRREVTDAIVLQMARVARSQGASFATVLLRGSAGRAAHYAALLSRREAALIDCRGTPGMDLEAMTVVGEGHPNGARNSHWAQCVLAELRRSPALLSPR